MTMQVTYQRSTTVKNRMTSAGTEDPSTSWLPASLYSAGKGGWLSACAPSGWAGGLAGCSATEA